MYGNRNGILNFIAEDQWKLHHDEQFELNAHLEKQIMMMNQKLKEMSEEMLKSGNAPLWSFYLS